MTISLENATKKKIQVEMFDRAVGQWKILPLLDQSVSFELGPGLGDLLRITKAVSE